ncbi:MAG: hypothetical protein K2X82_08265 [Gemmataceae bacterium]|nr:hypothetical protein [Gemmataceae bacterium]
MLRMTVRCTRVTKRNGGHDPGRSHYEAEFVMDRWDKANLSANGGGFVAAAGVSPPVIDPMAGSVLTLGGYDGEAVGFESGKDYLLTLAPLPAGSRAV